MYIGLDLGSSGLRALLIDEQQTVRGSAESHYEMLRPHPGWSEQNPADWIAATKACFAALNAEFPKDMKAVRGIGISGQMHGATVLDAARRVLRPCILWNDTRSAVEAAALDADPRFRDLTGNIVFPGFTAPKLAWMRTHEPDLFAQVDLVLLPKDYLRLWLTGEEVSDFSDAAGTSWLDGGSREWSADLLAETGLTPANMPPLVHGSASSGHVRDAVAGELGLPTGVTVAGGGADNAVAACGIGAVRGGQGFVSLGTSGVLLAAIDQWATSPAQAVHAFCHAVPDAWYQMGVTLSATDSANWLSGVTGQSVPEMAASVGETVGGPSEVMFLPYLSGERTPHNDASMRGAFIGLAHQSDSAALMQAVMEGVAFSMADCMDALKSSGTAIDSLLAIGGGSQSRFWVETLATVLGQPIGLLAGGENGAAMGAARLAIMATTGGSTDEIMHTPTAAETIDPRREHSAAYADALARYRRLYPALKASL
jgi:xylulokinase